ncbi:MAG TPA: type II toxin-antitoxin system prevent-host-death family antitoxin [Pseudonocardiaceae bacterium]|nr:type II toxin-antitoxin system prevent-host-death family antitoxin [Pseudonocardiaceae bacterium]
MTPGPPLDISFRPQDLHIEVTVSHARAHLPELVDQVRQGRTVYLTRYGKRQAALVAPATADEAERQEDAYWSARAYEAEASPGESTPWPEVIAEAERTQTG